MRNDSGWDDANPARKRAHVQVQKDYEGVQMKSSREQFEEWYMENWGHTEDDHETLFEREPDCPEDYYRFGVRLAHHAWQASRAAIEIELPRAKYYGDHWSGDWALDPELVVDSINEAGVKVKP